MWNETSLGEDAASWMRLNLGMWDGASLDEDGAPLAAAHPHPQAQRGIFEGVP